VTIAEHFPLSLKGKRFCQFFDHRYSFIEAILNGEDRPDWKTISAYPIEHRNLWNRFLDPDTLIGVSFGSSTHYAVIDIDRGSPYHPYTNEAALKELLEAYEDVGFNDYLIVRSSFSEGIHVYFPLPKEVPTHKLAVMMKLTAIRGGFIVKDGTLEIFPNAKPYNKYIPTPYKAHRLPLQIGSYLLDQNFDPYTDNIKTFLDQVDRAAEGQDIDLIETAIEAAHQTKDFRHIKGDGSRAEIFKRDLKEQIEEGWTDFGQTNDLLRIIGTYGRVFEGLEGKALADYIASTAKGLPGYREYCQHQHHIGNRAREWARCIEKFYYPYGSDAIRLGTFGEMVSKGSKEAKENNINTERQQSAIDRIKTGVDFIKEKLIEIPERVGEMKELLINAIKDLFGVRPSDQTLNRYPELWHPDFLREVEIVILGEPAQEEAPDLKPDAPISDVPQEGTSPDILQPEALLEVEYKLCHTPPAVAQKTQPSAESLNPLLEEESSVYAIPPLYMKVIKWASDQEVLNYCGNPVYGRVEIEGEKKQIFQSISFDQQVLIISQWHSSLLFHPEDEENLQVYVQPLNTEQTWLVGIPVLAKNLYRILDG
jgi:hypothetical protein